MINILVNGLTRTFGGIESLFYSVIQNVDKEQFHFDFLCFENTAARADDFKKLGSNVIYIPRPGKNYVSYKRALDQVFENNKYDIYHVNLTRYKPDYDIKVAKLSGCKIIIHSHLTGINKAKNPIYTIMRHLEFLVYRKPVIKRADLLMACSEDAGHYLFGKLPFNILYNGIDYTKFYYSQSNRNTIRKEFHINDDEILFGNVGRLTIQKNQAFLLQVFKSVYEKNKKVKLLIVGDGERRSELQAYINDNNLSKAVILTGNRSDVGKILSALDCFVLPSIREALPISLIEAQVNGLKCIISNNITYEVDISEITRVSIRGDVLQDWVDLLLSIGKRNNSNEKNNIEEKFMIERCVKNLEAAYMRLI